LTKRTLLVLGAGASQPYGFPSGETLQRKIVDTLAQEGPESPAAVVAAASGATIGMVRSFREELRRSGEPSVDAFIERTGTAYDLIGRCAIAQQLLPLETDDAFGRADDWYGHLLARILNTPPTWMAPHFRITTFNFDRSYERRWFLELQKRMPSEEINNAFDWMSVHHLHGHLGWPDFGHRYNEGAGMKRDYVPESGAGRIGHGARNIWTFSREITDGTGRVVADAFAWAERIFFIGFSYHPSNLTRLGAPESLLGKDVRGTVYGMSNEAIAEMLARTAGLIKPSPKNWAALEVVQQCEWFN